MNFLKHYAKYFSLIAVTFFGFLQQGQAAFNTVNLASSTVIVSGYTVTVTGQAEAAEVDSSNLRFGLMPGSSLFLESLDKKTFTITSSASTSVTQTCLSNSSTIQLDALLVQATTTITVLGNCVGSSSVPAQVMITGGSPTSNAITITWAAPDNGGDQITDYVVEYKAVADTGYTTWNHSPSIATSVTVTGLSTNVTYLFRVSAKNTIGTGLASSPFGLTTAVGVTPSAPLSVSARQDAERIAVSFLPPATQGDSAVTNYVLTANPGGILVSGATSPIIVTGLTPGTSYTFKVAAYNIYGKGYDSLDTFPVVFPYPVTTSSGGGGGGGGGGYFISIPRQVVYPKVTTPENSIPKDQQATFPVVPLIKTTDSLRRGLKNEDVWNLQKILIKEDLLTIPRGETRGLFGFKTERAVKDFQCNHDIVCSGGPVSTGWGAVGAATLSKINEKLSEETSYINQNLWTGLKNEDVWNLQKILIKEDLLTIPRGETRGLFGFKTERAVKDFQCNHDIVCSGGPVSTGWGAVGPITRSILNKSIHE